MYGVSDIAWPKAKNSSANNTLVLVAFSVMKRDGWLKESSGVWILRFRYDWESWDANPKVLIDKVRLEKRYPPPAET